LFQWSNSQCLVTFLRTHVCYIVASSPRVSISLRACVIHSGVELQAVCTGGTLSDLISQIGTTDISYICKYLAQPQDNQCMMCTVTPPQYDSRGTSESSTATDSSWAGMNYWDSDELRATMMDHSGMYHIQNATAPTIMFHGAKRQHCTHMVCSHVMCIVTVCQHVFVVSC
jgi:hypothetical protein